MPTWPADLNPAASAHLDVRATIFHKHLHCTASAAPPALQQPLTKRRAITYSNLPALLRQALAAQAKMVCFVATRLQLLH